MGALCFCFLGGRASINQASIKIFISDFYDLHASSSCRSLRKIKSRYKINGALYVLWDVLRYRLNREVVIYSGYQSHATLSGKTSRQNLSFGGRQSSPPPCRFTWKTEEYSLKPCSGQLVKIEPLQGVLGNRGTGAFIFREQGIFSNYFQGTRELLNRLLGTRRSFRSYNRACKI